MRTVNYALTDAKLKSLKFSDRPPQKPKKDGTMPKESASFKVTDGGGMFVRISAKGQKTFAYAYNFKGRPRELTIGNFPEIKLKRARELHEAARTAVAEGRDPAAEKIENKRKQREVKLTFRMASEDWLKKNSVKWIERTRARKEELLTLYAYPKFGNVPLAEVKPHHVHARLPDNSDNRRSIVRLVLLRWSAPRTARPSRSYRRFR